MLPDSIPFDAQVCYNGFNQRLEAVLLAPTAVNQQKFLFTLEQNGTVSAQPGHAFYVKMNLGIVKYHFEVGAGKENFQWA